MVAASSRTDQAASTSAAHSAGSTADLNAPEMPTFFEQNHKALRQAEQTRRVKVVSDSNIQAE